MSTQSSSFPSVPFFINQTQQNFRLLELPQDLLDLLKSSDRPEKLYLKSAPSHTDTIANNHSKDVSTTKLTPEEHLHLCTDDKIWSIRQVSTSNSVYITQTIQAETDDHNSRNGISAISKINNTLELSEKSIEWDTIEGYIRELVPIYPYESNEDIIQESISSPFSTIQNLIDNIPAPTNLIKEGCFKLYIFSFPINTGNEKMSKIYIPSSSLLLKTWKILLQTSTILNLDLRLISNEKEILNSIIKEEGKRDGELFVSVGKTILETMTKHDWNEEKLLRFLAGIILRCSSLTSHTTMPIEDLDEKIQELLPQHLSNNIIYSPLDIVHGGEEYDGTYCLSKKDDLIHYELPRKKEKSISLSDPQIKTNNTTTSTGKRKWHERFGKQRDGLS